MRLAATALLMGACSGGSDDGPALPCGVPPASGAPPSLLPPPNVAPCDAQGWCWESPLPFRDGLGAIWHRTDQTIIAGSRGHVLRLRDGAWRALPGLPRPTGADGVLGVHDIWAAGDNIYIAGDIGIDGIVWAYDGAAWAIHPVDGINPFHIWGTRAREVMVAGAGGARLFSGGRWSDVPPPRSMGQGLWGCDDSYFAGLYGPGEGTTGTVVARYRGGGWSTLEPVPETNVQFSAVSGAANDDVFASGIVNGASRNIAWHFDGAGWTDLALADSPGLLDIVALGGGQALAVGVGTDGLGRAWRWNGAAWTATADRSLLALSVATAGDILARTNLNVVQFDGAQWTDPFLLPLEGPLAAKSLTGIWGLGGTTFLIAADGSIFQRAGGDWTSMTTPAPASRTLNAIWGATPSRVFAVGSRGLIWLWDGATWSEMPLPAVAGTPDLNAVWSSTVGPAFAVGSSGTIFRFDGVAWTLQERVAEDLVGIWGSAATDVWAIGVRGRVVHFDGNTWSEAASLGNDVRSNIEGLWGSGPDQLWAVGGGSVWRYDGGAWTETLLSAAGTTTAIWGRAANDVYVVGGGGMAFHFDGTTWSDIHAEHAWRFNAIWGDATQIRAVGDLGTVSVR
jgi:hypothetical protein